MPLRASGTTSDQIFNLTPVTAVGTAVVDNSGRVTGIRITTVGSNYTGPPTITIIDPRTDATTGLPNGGKGATGLPIINAGTIVGVQITNPGSGYSSTSLPTVAFIGGNTISPGMGLMVTKPTTNAGVAIGGCRVVGPNQIAITYVNCTSAAVTPTAEAYSICGLHTMPATTNVISYGVVATGLASVASITSSEQSITINGLAATDIVVGCQKPTLSWGSAQR